MTNRRRSNERIFQTMSNKSTPPAIPKQEQRRSLERRFPKDVRVSANLKILEDNHSLMKIEEKEKSLNGQNSFEWR